VKEHHLHPKESELSNDVPDAWNVAVYDGTTQVICEVPDSCDDTKED
jgi:hypothetical protein